MMRFMDFLDDVAFWWWAILHQLHLADCVLLPVYFVLSTYAFAVLGIYPSWD